MCLSVVLPSHWLFVITLSAGQTRAPPHVHKKVHVRVHICNDICENCLLAADATCYPVVFT